MNKDAGEDKQHIGRRVAAGAVAVLAAVSLTACNGNTGNANNGPTPTGVATAPQVPGNSAPAAANGNDGEKANNGGNAGNTIDLTTFMNDVTSAGFEIDSDPSAITLPNGSYTASVELDGYVGAIGSKGDGWFVFSFPQLRIKGSGRDLNEVAASIKKQEK